MLPKAILFKNKIKKSTKEETEKISLSPGFEPGLLRTEHINKLCHAALVILTPSDYTPHYVYNPLCFSLKSFSCFLSISQNF
jgi:hypothetical protein